MTSPSSSSVTEVAGFAALADLVVVRPLGAWPGGAMTAVRRRSPFSATWRSTVALLSFELRKIGARDTVLQLAIDESQLRRDGLPRADARLEHPGIVLTFQHPNAGPLTYPCDRFDAWGDNIRAIALSLGALRTVDRYGVTRSGEQYRGWKALPAEAGQTAMTPQQAAAVLLTAADRAGEILAAELLLPRHRALVDGIVRDARRRAHPDSGGSVKAFQQVEAARAVLNRHFGLSQ